MNINLINYKLFKASEENKQEHLKTIHFTEGFSEGIAKVVEFVSSGKAIYYGEYLNNKRDGKGNEYTENGVLTFEGEFLKGKKWNGKQYDINNNTFYEIINGNGFIKEYYTTGDIMYEGSLLNGKRNGQGKEYYSNGELKFEGEFLYNYKIKGKEYLNGNLEYEGEYLLDKKWNGKGYDKDGKLKYELKNGNGKVEEYYYNGIFCLQEVI